MNQVVILPFDSLYKKLRKGENENEKNLELILLVGNWVVVAIQAFTIFLYGNSIGLFIIMLLALSKRQTTRLG